MRWLLLAKSARALLQINRPDEFFDKRSDLLQIGNLQILQITDRVNIMPSRNILRYDRSDAYYHVYLRGVDRGLVFRGPEDKNYLLYLFSRHLSIEEKKTKTATLIRITGVRLNYSLTV